MISVYQTLKTFYFPSPNIKSHPVYVVALSHQAVFQVSTTPFPERQGVLIHGGDATT